MAREGLQKLFDHELKKNTNKKVVILEETLINLEAQNAIYSTWQDTTLDSSATVILKIIIN